MDFGIRSIIESLDPTTDAWGARALFKDGVIDLLPDRQSHQGNPAWIGLVNLSLPFIRETVRTLWMEGTLTPDKVVEVYNQPGIRVSARAAGGYLYITAFHPEVVDRETLKWSSEAAPPEVGDSVKTRMGDATVLAFHGSHGYLGIIAELSDPPEWFTAQAKKDNYSLAADFFGADLR